MTTPNVLLFVTLLAAGLLAGLLFGWMVASIPGLIDVPARTYVETMQSINRGIINPGFLVPFVGTPLLLAVAAWVHFATGRSRRGWWLLGAAVIYVVGVIAVTFGGNIPLNDQLEAFDMTAATDAEVAAQRNAYEGPWNRWHTVRTVASIVALGCVSIAALTDPGGE